MKNEEGEQHGFLKSSAPPKEVSQRLGRIPWPIITTVCIDHIATNQISFIQKKKKSHHHFLSLISPEDGMLTM
jgi:hypothetical protein